MLTKVQIDPKLKMAIDKAIIMRAEGHFEAAHKFEESIRFLFDESEPAALRRYLNGLGVSEFTLGNYEKAINAYELALRLPATESYEELERAAVEGNIANALVGLHRTNEAHAFLDHSEEVLRANHVDDWLADRLETRARAFLLDGENQKALEAAKEAFDLAWNCFSSESINVALKTLSMCWDGCRLTR